MLSASIHTSAVDPTIACGSALGVLVAPRDVIVLCGDLGAGKTHLSKGLAAGLGVAEPVTSPTFNILLVHRGRIPLYHFDLYRLDRADQLIDIDYFETVESDGVSVVEWGDRFAEVTDECTLVVDIRIIDDTARELHVTAHSRRGEELLVQWLEGVRGLDGVTCDAVAAEHRPAAADPGGVNVHAATSAGDPS